MHAILIGLALPLFLAFSCAERRPAKIMQSGAESRDRQKCSRTEKTASLSTDSRIRDLLNHRLLRALAV